MRLADEKDVEVLCKLRVLEQKEDWGKDFEDKYDLVKQTKEYLLNHINKDFFMFVEECEGKIIATCGLQIIEYMPQCNDNGKQGFICNVFTIEEFRNKGIQTKLLENVVKFAKKHQICELDLSTDSKIAISMYKKLGFKFDDWAMKQEL